MAVGDNFSVGVSGGGQENFEFTNVSLVVPGPALSGASVFQNGDQKTAILPFSFGVWTQQVHGKKKAILGAIGRASCRERVSSVV